MGCSLIDCPYETWVCPRCKRAHGLRKDGKYKESKCYCGEPFPKVVK